jgi:HPt (histidine-containing phosphotransfer) domain-containing protein
MEPRAAGVFDPSRLAAVCGEGEALNHDLLVQLLGMFLDDNGARVRELAQVAPTGRAEAVRRLAHAIGGSAGTAGATRVAELARAMERDAVNGVSPGTDAVNALVEEFAALRRTLLERYPAIRES